MTTTISQKNTHDNSLRDLIRPMIIALLPVDMPYKIGIMQDIYYRLLPDWPGSRKRLRKTIEGILYSRCHSYAYQEALFKGQKRYGIDGRAYKLDDRHRLEAKKQLMAIKKQRKRKR